MNNSDLLSYIGAIAGVVGAVTGIAGAVMGYMSYRKTGEIKSIELRLELTKMGVEVFQKADDLSALLVRAERSRNAISAAMGLYKSGAHELWMRQLKADEESISSINESVDQLNVDYSKSSLHELEKSLSELHALRIIVTGISEKYLSFLAEDDRNRDFIRDRTLSRVQG